jgi:hypothetical protein
VSRIALLYSGGLDSNVAAVKLLESFERVHLLTWDTGRGLVFVRWVHRSSARLQARFPGRFEHHVADIQPVFDAITTRRLHRLYARYRQRFVWCLGCKVSMHLASLAFCKAHDITDAADGSADDTPYYVEQMPVALTWLHAWYESHGVGFHTPLAGAGSREEKRAVLDELNIPRGRTLFGRNPGTQPLCLPGNLIYAPSTFLNLHPRFDEGRVRAFLDDQRGLFDELLASQIERLRG